VTIWHYIFLLIRPEGVKITDFPVHTSMAKKKSDWITFRGYDKNRLYLSMSVLA
jgi:hypothetical protein